MGPVTLLILDGWGISQEQKGNAILAARTPNYREMLSKFSNCRLDASGISVGLPPGLMGNSEVGHLNIGAGRVVVQKLTMISQTILDGTFFKNPAIVHAIENIRKTGGKLHLIGLVSDGCVHSSPDHLDGLLKLAQKEKIARTIIHPILDGRDTPPRSARRFMRELQEKLQNQLPGTAEIGVVCGRYYAMDRDNRWERTERYWRSLILGDGLRATSALEAIDQAYARNQSDEFVVPTVISGNLIESGDSVICFNFRPDRVRQISRCLTQHDFNNFVRPTVPDIYYVCLTEYDSKLNLPVAFSPEQLPSQDMKNTLPELLGCHHIHQFHTAETEKYAHVTYFFNGGKETPIPDEERELIESLKVATYDLAPQMQTPKVCDVTCTAIESGRYPFIVLNFANPDMVGHTGMMDAAVAAVESVDDAFGKLLESTRRSKGTLLITADHGNVEQMIDLSTGEPHTAHTTNPVPFIVADFSGRVDTKIALRDGALADVAPTILQLMNIPQPAEMTGRPLLKTLKSKV